MSTISENDEYQAGFRQALKDSTAAYGAVILSGGDVKEGLKTIVENVVAEIRRVRDE